MQDIKAAFNAHFSSNCYNVCWTCYSVTRFLYRTLSLPLALFISTGQTPESTPVLGKLLLNPTTRRRYHHFTKIEIYVNMTREIIRNTSGFPGEQHQFISEHFFKKRNWWETRVQLSPELKGLFQTLFFTDFGKSNLICMRYFLNMQIVAFQCDAYHPLVDLPWGCTCSGGVYLPGGVPAQGCTCRGLYLLGGCVPTQGDTCWGCTYLGEGAPAQVLPPLWTDRHV